MKSLKKIVAIIISALVVVCMGIPVFAAEPGITVENAANGETYTAYQILHATYEGELGEDTPIAYYYEGAATDPLYALLTGAGLQFDGFVEGKAYLKVQDAQGSPITYTEAQIKTLAANINSAMKAGTVTLSPAGSAVASGGTATIAISEKGFYFVDTTLGSVCSIDTAGDATIYEKNSVPSLAKQVKEDLTGEWGSSATAAFDDVVDYRITVNTGTNAKADGNGIDSDIIIIDTIPAAMAYVADSAGTTTPGITVNSDNAVWDSAAGTLAITLDAEEVAALGQDKDIVITYQAIFTSSAQANTDYVNEAVLTYKLQTSTSTATVKSFEFEIDKINADEDPLSGVTFTVSRAADGKYLNSAGEWVTVAQGTKAPELSTGSDGKIVVTGIDEDTYTVTEIETQKGYNKLDGPVTVVVAHDGTISVTGEGTASGTAVTIINLSGTVLPSTGGIGTTIFYVAGAVLVIGAGVLLITRRRARKR